MKRTRVASVATLCGDGGRLRSERMLDVETLRERGCDAHGARRGMGSDSRGSKQGGRLLRPGSVTANHVLA